MANEMTIEAEQVETADGLADVMECICKGECCFIVAGRIVRVDDDNDDVAECGSPDVRKLESELKRSALTFYRIEGVPIKLAFFVCNNAYTSALFKKLAKKWIRDFSLGGLFVTNPIKRPDHGHMRTVRIEGLYLDGTGNAAIITDNVTADTIRGYFNLVQNATSKLVLAQETRSYDTVTSAGRRVSCAQFDRLYPGL